MSPLDSDIAHLLAGSMVLLSFLLLYQDRMFALLNVFALHATGSVRTAQRQAASSIGQSQLRGLL